MPVFDADRPLRVAVLFSGSASGFRYLADHDPSYGDVYEVVGGFASDPDCPGVTAFQERGVPVEAIDIEAFYEERGASTRDLDVREEFDAGTREVLAGYDPDLVLLSGYMWILTDPVVGEWPILNVHPADLAITDEGERKYAGFDPVFDAVTSGEPETRSTVHLVTPEVDEGPILVRSRPFAVHRDLVEGLEAFDAGDALRDYVDAHQEWMKWEGDGPAIATAVELVAEGRVERTDGGVVIDGEPGHYDLAADE